MADLAALNASWRASLLALLLCSASASAVASDAVERPAAPAPGLAVPLHEAIYHATVRRIKVRAGLRLEQQDDGLYTYRSWVEPRGLLSFINRELKETSLVMLDGDGGIVPLSYRRRDELNGRHSDIRFDLAEHQVHIDYRGRQTTTDWEPGIYDLLSLRLVLSNDLARGKLQDEYRIIDDRARVEEVDVEIAGREILSTPLGEVETLRLEYRSRRRDRLFRLWIAPDMDGALIRLEQYEEGSLRGALEIVEYRRL